MTHTPGPWEVDSGDPFAVISVDWGGIADVPNEPAENDALMAMARANAILIASAPELLEACKAVYDLLGSMRITTTRQADAREAFFKLGYAISKAEGVQ